MNQQEVQVLVQVNAILAAAAKDTSLDKAL